MAQQVIINSKSGARWTEEGLPFRLFSQLLADCSLLSRCPFTPPAASGGNALPCNLQRVTRTRDCEKILYSMFICVVKLEMSAFVIKTGVFPSACLHVCLHPLSKKEKKKV